MEYLTLGLVGCFGVFLLGVYSQRHRIDNAVANYIGGLAIMAGDLAAQSFHEKLEELADEAEEEYLMQEDLAEIKTKGEVN